MNNLKELIGKKIMAIRPISKKELEVNGWDDIRSATCVLILDNGGILYPSSDDEGNSPGTLYYADAEDNYIVWDKKVIM